MVNIIKLRASSYAALTGRRSIAGSLSSSGLLEDEIVSFKQQNVNHSCMHSIYLGIDISW